MKTKYHSTLLTAGAEGGEQTQNKSIRRNWNALALGGLLFTSIVAPSVRTVEAQCQQWDVSGKWKIRQGSFTLPVILSQNGKTVSGTAAHKGALIQESSGPLGVEGFGVEENLAGTVNGTVEGDKLEVQINWAGGGAGVYRGTIGKNGVIRGMTYDKKKPSSTATWQSSKVMKCADEEVVQPTNPPPAPVHEFKSTGKKPTPPPVPVHEYKSTGKVKTSAAAPTIKANPVVVTIPAGQSHGRTTLTWDGGPDHPDAEVWLKDTKGEERLVVRQGTGTRSVTVEAGKNYQVILKDAGEQLARAAVLTKQ